MDIRIRAGKPILLCMSKFRLLPITANRLLARTMTLVPRCLHVLILLIVCAIALPGCAPDPHREELEEAFERYLAELNEAYFTLDTSELSQATTGDQLVYATVSVEAQRGFSVIEADEFDIAWVRVIDYSDAEAIIEVRTNYRQFYQDFETGERTYWPTDRWRWRVEQVTLVREDGVWKVSEIHFVEWSG